MRFFTSAFPASAHAPDPLDVEFCFSARLVSCWNSFFALTITNPNIAVSVSDDRTRREIRFVSFSGFFLRLSEYTSLPTAKFTFCLSNQKQIAFTVWKKGINDLRFKDGNISIKYGVDIRNPSFFYLFAKSCPRLPRKYLFFSILFHSGYFWNNLLDNHFFNGLPLVIFFFIHNFSSILFFTSLKCCTTAVGSTPF